MNRDHSLQDLSYSPFTPGRPVPVELFVGRNSQIEDMALRVRAVIGTNLQAGFLTGERGIGKSSLASFVGQLVERNNGLLPVHAYLGASQSLGEAIRQVLDRILKVSDEKPWWGKISQLFGNRIKKAGLFGVSLEFGATPRELAGLAEEFLPVLRKICQGIESHQRTGLFIVLDDINGLASDLRFANWIKSVVDEASTSRTPVPAYLLLVGMEQRRQTLIDSQPSLARLFHPFAVTPWDEGEASEFFENAFEKVGMRIDPVARGEMVKYCGGLPVLAQEIGDAVFHMRVSDTIDWDTAFAGIVAAAQIVGLKHVKPRVLDALRSVQYKHILATLCSFEQPLQLSFTRKDLMQLLDDTAKKNNVDNFLQTMRRLGVIDQDPDRGRGAYMFSNLLDRLYIAMYSNSRREA